MKTYHNFNRYIIIFPLINKCHNLLASPPQKKWVSADRYLDVYMYIPYIPVSRVKGKLRVSRSENTEKYTTVIEHFPEAKHIKTD
jgi:CRISPR/Cas system CMR subunit Cmr6 (Cas7 group RAMP superfamily)